MPQFCILFYANYTILANQRGAMAQWPSPKYAPAYKPIKYHFQERKNATLCVSSFYLPRPNKDLWIFACLI